MLRLDECELNVGVEVSAEVFEGQFELLDAGCLLYCEGNDVLARGFVVQLPHALYRWVVQETKEQNLKLTLDRLLLEHHSLVAMVDMLLQWRLLLVLQADFDERNDSRLQLVFGSLNHYDELLA